MFIPTVYVARREVDLAHNIQTIFVYIWHCTHCSLWCFVGVSYTFSVVLKRWNLTVDFQTVCSKMNKTDFKHQIVSQIFLNVGKIVSKQWWTFSVENGTVFTVERKSCATMVEADTFCWIRALLEVRSVRDVGLAFRSFCCVPVCQCCVLSVKIWEVLVVGRSFLSRVCCAIGRQDFIWRRVAFWVWRANSVFFLCSFQCFVGFFCNLLKSKFVEIWWSNFWRPFCMTFLWTCQANWVLWIFVWDSIALVLPRPLGLPAGWASRPISAVFFPSGWVMNENFSLFHPTIVDSISLYQNFGCLDQTREQNKWVPYGSLNQPQHGNKSSYST